MPHTNPKPVKLKDGESVTLRRLNDDDDDRLIKFFADLPNELTQFLRSDVKDPDVVRGFIHNEDPSKIWCIVAETDGKEIVGDATLHMQKLGWTRHVGEIRVVVTPKAQKNRLATTMIRELVNQASGLGLRKLVCRVLETQVGAQKALVRVGFREEARLTKHATDHEGTVHDMILLTNSVDDLWKKMEDMMEDMDMSKDMY